MSAPGAGLAAGASAGAGVDSAAGARSLGRCFSLRLFRCWRWRCRRLLSLWSLRCRCCLGLRLFRRSGRLFSLGRLRRGRRCWLLGLRRFRCRGRLGLRRFWRGSRLLRLWRFRRRRGFRCRRGRGLWQRVRAVCLGAQEGDHLCPLIGVRQAWEGHHGARREFGGLVDQPVEHARSPMSLRHGPSSPACS